MLFGHKTKKGFRAVIAILVLLTASVVPVKNAQAQVCCPCCTMYTGCFNSLSASVVTEWGITDIDIKTHVMDEFNRHRTWIIDTFWGEHLLPAMMMMSDQLSAVAMQQTQIIGSFIDAKHQMETQRVLQTIRARAHKDYHPSNGMCEFGTSVKSLAASERKAELNAHVMSQRSQDRQLGNADVAASLGPSGDFKGRIEQYKSKFCDPSDHNGNLYGLCAHPAGVGATNPERANKDIDYARTLASPWTLDVDFTDNQLTDTEEEILALSNNLYGQHVFKRIAYGALAKGASTTANPNGDPAVYTANRGSYMDARALLAKLSVAENSFNAQASMKSAGTSGSRAFLEAILDELGVNGANGPPDDILRALGMDSANPNAAIGPSYHAQMEVLTKKIYQNPNFYTNLYDKPANVERKKVAMQAIGLMQKFDLFKSYLRNEASLSVLLELSVIDLQGHIENELSE